MMTEPVRIHGHPVLAAAAAGQELRTEAGGRRWPPDD